jgi:hypothetical protein
LPGAQGVKTRRPAHGGHDVSAQRPRGDAARIGPGQAFALTFHGPVADEAELALALSSALIDHGADAAGIRRVSGAIENDLGYGGAT